MADLATRLCGLTLRNPLIAASCEYTMTESGIRSCVDAGAGAVVVKSINESPGAARQLAAADYALLDHNLHRVPWASATGTETLLNRSGLPGAAIDDWLSMLERVQAHATSRGAVVIGSVTVRSPDEGARLAARMAEVVPAIEVNIGAPHGREGQAVSQLTESADVAHCVRTMRAAISGPLIVKLPGQASDLVALAKAARESGADAIALMGRLNGLVPNLETWEPELGSTGAVGGPWMLPISLYWVAKCRKALSSGTPIIGTNGARSGLDLARFLLAGANAIEVASVLMMRGPRALTHALEELEAYLAEHGVEKVDDMLGASTARIRGYDEIEPVNQPRQPWLDE